VTKGAEGKGGQVRQRKEKETEKERERRKEGRREGGREGEGAFVLPVLRTPHLC
jgi:hypothetical protein